MLKEKKFLNFYDGEMKKDHWLLTPTKVFQISKGKRQYSQLTYKF